MKGYFKYTTQLISSKGTFHCSVLSKHPPPYRPSYTGSQSVCTGNLVSVGGEFTIKMERQYLERRLIDTVDDERKLHPSVKQRQGLDRIHDIEEYIL